MTKAVADMVGLVLDCSVTISWVLADERPPESKKILDTVVEQGAIVPELWSLEIGNTLLVAQRRKRVTSVQRKEALHRLADMPVTTDRQTSERAWNDTLNIADTHGISLYDATYLELALRTAVPLATFDKALASAAEKSKAILFS